MITAAGTYPRIYDSVRISLISNNKMQYPYQKFHCCPEKWFEFESRINNNYYL